MSDWFIFMLITLCPFLSSSQQSPAAQAYETRTNSGQRIAGHNLGKAVTSRPGLPPCMPFLLIVCLVDACVQVWVAVVTLCQVLGGQGVSCLLVYLSLTRTSTSALGE